MFPTYHPNFDLMDELSLKKVPFFFMVDFLLEKVEVFLENEIEEESLLIDFQNFKNMKTTEAENAEIELKILSESAEIYRKGFDFVQENLRQGNSYLTNYTMKSEIAINLTLKEIFYHSKAKYKVWYNDEFVFFSPETFVEIIDC